MRKLTSFLMVAAIVCLQALANPAHRGSVMMPQPDGTMLSVCLEGDEYYHFNTTADGYTILLTDDGAYEYARLDGEPETEKTYLSWNTVVSDMSDVTKNIAMTQATATPASRPCWPA